MEKKKGILFVEGSDDEHTIYALCNHFNLIPTFKDVFEVEVPDSKGEVNKKAKATEKGGFNNVLKALQASLNGSLIERVGIVIDADSDLQARWQSVKSILERAGYEDLDKKPNPDGTIIIQADKMIFGVWIMPDNKIESGYLETFLTHLVPKKNKSWEQAKNCVDALEDKPFIKQNVDHTTKAEIHTFLAWQEEPGKPFGQAITAKYLQADNPNCKKFIEWLNRLFIK